MSDKPMNLREFLKLKFELQAKYGLPLKAVRMSKATAATFPALPFQSTFETLSGVPIEWDETLGVGEYIPVYVDELVGKTRVEIAQMVIDSLGKRSNLSNLKVLSVEEVTTEGKALVPRYAILHMEDGTKQMMVGLFAHEILRGKR